MAAADLPPDTPSPPQELGDDPQMHIVVQLSSDDLFKLVQLLSKPPDTERSSMLAVAWVVFMTVTQLVLLF